MRAFQRKSLTGTRSRLYDPHGGARQRMDYGRGFASRPHWRAVRLIAWSDGLARRCVKPFPFGQPGHEFGFGVLPEHAVVAMKTSDI